MMALCALIQNNIVTAVIDLDEQGIQDAAKTHQAVIDVSSFFPAPVAGWMFNGSTVHHPGGSGTIPVKITRLAFRKRFTQAELGAIYTVAQSQVMLRVYLDDLAAATFVDLTRPDTILSVQTLAALGLISAERVPQILSTNTTEIERFVQ